MSYVNWGSDHLQVCFSLRVCSIFNSDVHSDKSGGVRYTVLTCEKEVLTLDLRWIVTEEPEQSVYFYHFSVRVKRPLIRCSSVVVPECDWILSCLSPARWQYRSPFWGLRASFHAHSKPQRALLKRTKSPDTGKSSCRIRVRVLCALAPTFQGGIPGFVFHVHGTHLVAGWAEHSSALDWCIWTNLRHRSIRSLIRHEPFFWSARLLVPISMDLFL